MPGYMCGKTRPIGLFEFSQTTTSVSITNDYGSHIINVLYLFPNVTKKRFVVDSIYLQILIT